MSLDGRFPERHSEMRPEFGRGRGALGILAGGGTLPVEIAQHALSVSQRPVHIIALEGEADDAVAAYPHTWVNWGQLGRMVKALRRHGCTQMVLAGTVRRPNLRTLRPDIGLLLALPRILRTLRGGDDSVLRRVVGYFESKGFIVVGLADVAPHLLAPAGSLGARLPSREDEAAIARGLAVLGALGPFDVGQAVVATHERIVAIEGAGGTDAMLASLVEDDRGCAPRRRDTGGVLVKWPKPGQELRLDLPAAGPRTVEFAAKAGLRGIAVRAGAAVFLDRSKFKQAAEAAGVFVVGLDHDDRESIDSTVDASAPDAALSVHLHMRTRRIPSVAERLDIALGRKLLAALQPHHVGGSVVIARQYVLAVAARESVLEVLERAAHLRQWSRKGGRVGTLVMREDAAVPPWLTIPGPRKSLLDALKSARLAGLVVVTSGLPQDDLTPFVARMNEERLFLVTAEPAP